MRLMFTIKARPGVARAEVSAGPGEALGPPLLAAMPEAPATAITRVRSGMRALARSAADGLGDGCLRARLATVHGA